MNTKTGPLSLINPVIIKKSLRQELGEEGCLSLPNKFGEVKRHISILLKYTDWQGQAIVQKMRGFQARIAQHEIDHLNGVLFTDIAKNVREIKEI